jgi:hypothetical protein
MKHSFPPHFSKTFVTGVLIAFCAGTALAAPNTRQVISLNGTWEIAEGTLEATPTAFGHKVPVPGLVDMAQPSFVEPGPKVANRSKLPSKDPRRDAFWYRRTFTISDAIPPVATLKVSKAMFGTRVILNGRVLGDHAPCFTPGFFDARPALKTGRNELIIRVGADREAVTTAVPSGFDYEKEHYFPGIFDSVELILSGTPNIVNLQVAPDLANNRAHVRIWLQNVTKGEVTVEVREAKSRKAAGKASASLTESPEQVVDIDVPISNCRHWSPEDPFLYEIIAHTAGDAFTTRFGMREFKLDPTTGRAMLNGKPYFLRGSNITLYRFFEDPDRGALPWSEDWVRKLHRRVKDMHWNSLRYCIGFPPEEWYRIADEEGILIQDEFPIWFGGPGWSTWPPELKADQLAKEYAEWMRERWNHPSVVIWDADNETSSPELGTAIQQVRSLDLSGRPWDNSYNPPQEPGDVFESHPYHFQNANFKLADIARADPVPQGSAIRNDGKHAGIINEYGWLWLNRDGTPTTLTRQLYENLLGTNSTTAQRRHLYARYTAAETEFWRSHRKAAGVLHFTALGYSRPDGQTSDHWLDIKKLTWEPEFYRYVRDAFAPVGLMIDAWAADYLPRTKQDFRVSIVNDLETPWKGEVRFRILRDGKTVTEERLPTEVAGTSTADVLFKATIPELPGQYQAEAVLTRTPAGPVRSLRDFSVLSAEQREARRNLAEGRAVTASSVLTKDGTTYRAELAVDGNPSTRWSSEFSEPQWLAVDLGAPQTISRITLLWEAAFAKAYSIEFSLDGQTWQEVYTTSKGGGNLETLRFTPKSARWVRLNATKRATDYGISLFELGVYH